MIVEAGFADRDHPRTLCQLAQWRDDVLAGFLNVSWMNADYGKDVRISLRKIDSATAAFNRSADRDDARDTGSGGAAQNIIEVASEIRVVEMRVSFYQHYNIKLSERASKIQSHSDNRFSPRPDSAA
jgi:hypothetical protein